MSHRLPNIHYSRALSGTKYSSAAGSVEISSHSNVEGLSNPSINDDANDIIQITKQLSKRFPKIDNKISLSRVLKSIFGPRQALDKVCATDN